MRKYSGYLLFVLLAVFLLTGCAPTTIDELYSPPRRPVEFQELQKAIDQAMEGLSYCAPLTGENQQAVQMADLDGDGVDEYLLFAQGTEDKPLQILVFSREAEEYRLRDRIESHGSAFELVEYVDFDGRPGMELVVGRQVSDQVLRSVTVHHFSEDGSELLMKTNYYKLVTADLCGDDRTELTVIMPGSTETDKASAVLYSGRDGNVERSKEVTLSAPAEQIKRIMTGNLQDGASAVYVASALEEQAIITDVLAVDRDRFTNVSYSTESGTSVQTLRNYYVYADDIDQDGILEMPSLITMVPYRGTGGAERQHLIRWYALDIQGRETDKMFTFHDLAEGWYLQLDSTWASRVTVAEEGGSSCFYVWDSAFERAEKLLTIEILTGSDREAQAAEDGRILLHRADSALYAAVIGDGAESYGITRENLADSFHLIFKDWKTGET